MDQLGEISTFVRVVEARSFAAAAQALGVTPSGVSKSIARLEARLGTRLLHRTTRSLNLTEAGQAFYGRCRDIMSRLADAESELAASRGTIRGRLRIDTPVALGRVLIVAPLVKFAQAHPDLTLQVSLSDRVVDLVDEGVDVAIRVGQLTDSRLVARRLQTTRIVAMASPAYLARHGTPREPEDLASHHCVNFFNPNTGQTLDWTFERDGVTRTVGVRSQLSLNSPEAMITALEAGAGVGRSSDYLATEALRAGRLVRVLPDWNLGSRPISALYLKTPQVNPKIRAVVDVIAEALQKLDQVPADG